MPDEQDPDSLGEIQKTSQESGLVEEWLPTQIKKEPESASPPGGQDKPLESILAPLTKEEVISPSSFPKKGFPKVPKTAIFAAIAVIFLGILGFIAVKLKSSDKSLVGKKGEIVWWGIEEEAASVAPLIEEYQEANPKIKISYMKQSTQDYRERLTNAIASGKGPDIFEIHNSWVPMFKNDLEVMPDSVMSSSDFARTFYPVITSDLTTQGGVVGMPLFFDAITLYINEDILTSAAKAPPKTWDELRDLAVALTQKDERGVILQSGVSLGRTENVDHWPEILGLMLLQNQANPAKPTGKLAEDAFSFFLYFYRTDAVWDEKLPPSTIAFAQGKTAMYLGPVRRASEIAKANPALKFKTVPVPQLPKEKPAEPDITYATYWVQGVWGRSINKDAAWEFLKFMSTKESLEKLNEEVKKTNLFERPSSRVDMSLAQSEDKIVASVIALALNAKSWYLAAPTYDGPTGINSQLNSVFARALEPKVDVKKILPDVAVEVARVLSQYGIAVK